MNFPKKVMLGSVLLLGATSVLADNADLRVIGTIAPSACTPVFTGGATVNYGAIPPASLGQTTETTLAARDVAYTITCNAPLVISTTWRDARAGTATTGAAPAINYFGLGQHDGTNIGRYQIANVVAGTTADGNAVDVIQKNTATGPWILSNLGTVANDGIRQYSYAPVGTLVPGAYSTYAGTIRVTSVITPTQNLNMNTEVTLDGLSTMTVNYL
ncbi:hypothetical protein C1Y35_30880 [Pseudomonas sp. GW456-L14]|uniref:DUF1120 domain-containing protein n=1 Tax=unclassified Pseudomonas TaxID=196821 RepID=UPI000C88BAA7|nr:MULTISPECIES: DUF1120 domain-containing protein [unclassified Pseudomonas]PMY30932.1 hypothetical protein C1Y35_30880 [Pseudomonas sp. GW456-L14]PMY48365.1 hypothetical protein C1Y34_30575 [Pseudomonas sp. GW456-L12]